MRFSLHFSPISLLLMLLFDALIIASITELAQVSIVLFIVVFYLIYFLFYNQDYNYILKKKSTYQSFKLYFLFFFIWMLMSLTNDSFSIRTITRIIQFASCGLIFFFAMQYPFKMYHFKFSQLVSRFLLVTCFIYWLSVGTPTENYSFIFLNPNFLGSVLLCWMVLLEINTKHTYVHLFECLFLILLCFFTSARASIVSMLLYFGIYSFCLKQNNKTFDDKFKYFYLLFVIEVIAASLFIVFSYTLIHTDIGNYFQELSREYFHKNFFSGRQSIWAYMVELIALHPILGYGLSVVPSDFMIDTKLSAHNGWLQIALQMGLVGLYILLSIMKRIMIVTFHNNSNPLRYIILPFVFVVLFHESFEVTLTQNFLVCALMQWFILGLGCNQYIIQKEM